MAYIGKEPANSFISFEKQVFTIVNSQTAYTLNHAITNENDIRLVVNNVIQEPGSGKAYTASGTTLTLSAALVNGTDEMYCVYLGRALQTVNAPDGSISNSQVAPTIITGQTAETSIATDDTILIHDTSASALRKMTRANFVSGIGGTNTPAFMAYKGGSGQSVSNTTHTVVTFDTEDYDTDNAWDGSNTFTVPSGKGGKYFLYAQAGRQGWDSNRFLIYFIKNGSTDQSASESAINTAQYHTTNTLTVADLSAGDTIQVKVYHDSGSTRTMSVGDRTTIIGFRIIE